jgi:uncharacterized protein YndB with AHSA1/START domain
MIEPIHASVRVRRHPQDAFRVFTAEIGTWWPVEAFSIAADTSEGKLKAESIEFEEREGGRVIEVMSDGRRETWATILAWEPPRRVVLAWKPNLSDRPPTELEITFTPEEGGTLVELEHRGWERLGSLADEARSSYGDNWGRVLGLFVEAADGA